MTKTDIKNFTLEKLLDYVVELGQPKYRAEQIFNWLYNHLSFDFNEMENLPKSLRMELSQKTNVQTLNIVRKLDSPLIGTTKFLFSTKDNNEIEAVIIPEGKRTTLCLSTQVGCPLNCKFCATGLMGFTRNLTVGEIVDQYLLTAREYGKNTITNIVFMGMGEPLLNYRATIEAIENFTNELTKGLSRNRITVSTAGIPDKIRALADSGLRVKIALSLHSPFNDVRNKLMPVNKKYSIEENIEALKYYARKTRTRITFEYLMLDGINDRYEDVQGLAHLTSQLPSKINLIPFNSIAHMNPGGFAASLSPSPIERISEFADKLRAKNITVMLRNTQGNDIAAACGQLAIQKKL